MPPAVTVTKRSIADLVRDPEQSPIPLHVFPNYMGINLCAVESITWSQLDDGQLVSMSIDFIPAFHKLEVTVVQILHSVL